MANPANLTIARRDPLGIVFSESSSIIGLILFVVGLLGLILHSTVPLSISTYTAGEDGNDLEASIDNNGRDDGDTDEFEVGLADGERSFIRDRSGNIATGFVFIFLIGLAFLGIPFIPGHALRARINATLYVVVVSFTALILYASFSIMALRAATMGNMETAEAWAADGTDLDLGTYSNFHIGLTITAILASGIFVVSMLWLMKQFRRIKNDLDAEHDVDFYAFGRSSTAAIILALVCVLAVASMSSFSWARFATDDDTLDDDYVFKFSELNLEQAADAECSEMGTPQRDCTNETTIDREEIDADSHLRSAKAMFTTALVMAVLGLAGIAWGKLPGHLLTIAGGLSTLFFLLALMFNVLFMTDIAAIDSEWASQDLLQRVSATNWVPLAMSIAGIVVSFLYIILAVIPAAKTLAPSYKGMMSKFGVEYAQAESPYQQDGQEGAADDPAVEEPAVEEPAAD